MLVLVTRGRATWLPRAAVATTGAAVLLFALSDPERRIAEHNLERYERTGKIDPRLPAARLGATPGLTPAPEPAATGCAGFNLARHQRAASSLARVRSVLRGVLGRRPHDPEPYAFERRRALLLRRG